MNLNIKITLLVGLYIVTGISLQAQNQPNLPIMKQHPNQLQYQCIADDDPAYTAQLAKEVFALCPPLRPDRFVQRIWRLWGLDLSAYPADSLIVIGGDNDMCSLVLCPNHRLIWMKTYQTSIYGDEVPKSFPAEQYALLYRYLMMDDTESLQTYFKKYIEDYNYDISKMPLIDFIEYAYSDALFDIRPELLKYADNTKFRPLFTTQSYLISNLRFDAVSLYIQKELKTGKLLYFIRYDGKHPDNSSWNDYLVPFLNMIKPKEGDDRYYSFGIYLGDEINSYPIRSRESVAAGYVSTCLKFEREDVNNALVQEFYNEDNWRWEDIKRFKAQLEKNNYYGYTLVREFLTNPMREMPTLEKIGTNFRAVSNQSDIPLQIEPFSNSYAIDTIRAGETCRVYETGHDDYFFTEIDRPVESPVAGPDGYAMILDRTETIYGYVPKNAVRLYTDADLLNESRYKDPSKSKQGVITDSDGYVNIRQGQSASSTILGKLIRQDFRYWELPGNWYIVETSDGLRGFVYKDRIREKYDAGKWIIE